MIWIAIAIAAAVAIYGIHRVALWAEDRGWIFYKNRRGSLGSFGMAFIEATSMFAPEVEHAIEEQQAEEQRADVIESGSSGNDVGSFPGSVDFD